MPSPLMPLPPLTTSPPAAPAAARREARGLAHARHRPIAGKDAREAEAGDFSQTLRDASRAKDPGKPAERAGVSKLKQSERSDEQAPADANAAPPVGPTARDIVEAPNDAGQAGDVTGVSAAGETTAQPDDAVMTSKQASLPATSQSNQQAGVQPVAASASAGVMPNAAVVPDASQPVDDGGRNTSDTSLSQRSGTSTSVPADSRGTSATAAPSAVAAVESRDAALLPPSPAFDGITTPVVGDAVMTVEQSMSDHAEISGRREPTPTQRGHGVSVATASPAAGGDGDARGLQRSDARPEVPATSAVSQAAPTATASVNRETSQRSHAILADGVAAMPLPPAVSRAAQIDLAVRVENANGQAAGLDAQPLQVGPASQTSSQGASGNGFSFTQAGFGEAATLFDRAGMAEDEQFAPQIVRGLHAMMNQRGGAMTLRLDPPELGELRVQMTIARGVVTAEFHAGTQQAQTLLDKHMATLRQSLESQGLTVERLSVHASATQHGHQQHSTWRDDSGSSQQQPNPSWSSQHDAAGSESRGRREQDAHAPLIHAWEGEGLSFESLLGTDAGSSAPGLEHVDAERRGAGAMSGGFAR